MNKQQPSVSSSAPTRVIKKLYPQAPGARRWAASCGEQRVCVRYRVAPLCQRRLTTVEIVVDEAPNAEQRARGCARGLGREGAGPHGAYRWRHL